MVKYITPHNKKGQPHGYSEYYFPDGQLMFKGNYVNGVREGYFIEYRYNSYYKFFYNNGVRNYKKRIIPPNIMSILYF